MSDLLKEAIADAKAVRETALQNAKMALEEAFTPQLKSMLSAKLKEEDMEDEEDVAMDDEMGDDEMGDEEDAVDAAEAEIADEGDYDEAEMSYEDEMEDEEGGDEEMGDEEMGDEEEMEEEGLELEDIIRELEAELSEDGEVEEGEEVDETIEVNGVRYAPIQEAEEEEIDEIQKKGRAGYLKKGESDPDTAASDGVSVNESNDAEYEIDNTLFEVEDDEDEDKDDEVDEGKTPAVSSNIGKGGNPDDNYAPTEDPGKGKISEMASELAEYKEAVHFLKDKLHEVNILNAKLLFTNKLFKEFALDNNQKLKVVETFDRAQSTREIKLVYSTLAEQFSDNSNIINRKSITESASAKSGSTKPSKKSRKVISEESQVANRFKKLAGIL